MTRTERQQEAARKWIKNKGKGSIEAATGFGKTNVGLITIKALLKKFPQFRILVVVPNTGLKDQWQVQLDEWGFTFNSEVQIVNTVIKHNWVCDFLVLDECHRFSSDDFSKIFKCVKYKLILGLTATFERLDGKHILMEKYCPIVDQITFEEAVKNGWVSDYKEYVVLLNVDNIDEYKKLNKEWLEHFEFFEYKFDLAMSMVEPKIGWKNKLDYRNKLYKGNDEQKKKDIYKAINYHSARFNQTMQLRKSFVNNHPKKIEVARKIIEARLDKKIITFSNNIQMAESIGIGDTYTGKVSKKKGAKMIENFSTQSTGVLNTVKKADEGLDIPGLSVAIILGTDSSETKARQRRGRTVRKEEGKIAEVFYLVIKDTVESKWVINNHKTDKNYITIDEKGLEQVLNNENPELYKKKIQEQLFRY
jgi:RNA polymerase primary sigma factor